jgi:hypothetical protein
LDDLLVGLLHRLLARRARPVARAYDHRAADVVAEDGLGHRDSCAIAALSAVFASVKPKFGIGVHLEATTAAVFAVDLPMRPLGSVVMHVVTAAPVLPDSEPSLMHAPMFWPGLGHPTYRFVDADDAGLLRRALC